MESQSSVRLGPGHGVQPEPMPPQSARPSMGPRRGPSNAPGRAGRAQDGPTPAPRPLLAPCGGTVALTRDVTRTRAFAILTTSGLGPVFAFVVVVVMVSLL